MRFPSHPPTQAGFVLPLSMAGAFVLLLSSLSLQSAVLHGRQQQALDLNRTAADDRLGSAAQAVARELRGRYACLQSFPLPRWSEATGLGGCPDGVDPSELERLVVDGAQVQLESWEPQADGGELRLRLAGTERERRFGLSASGLRELG